MLKDLLDNIPLLVIMAAIILLVIVLFVLLIVQIAKKKKQAKNSQPVEESTEAPASEAKPEEKPTEPREEAQPVPTQVTAEEKSEEKQELTEEKEQEPMKKEEKAPVKKAEPKTTAKTAPKTTVKAAPKAAPKAATAEKKPVKAVAAAKVSNSAGKWVLYEEDRGGYGFRLVANNGEEMLRCSSPYATLQSAKSGIKTYQDNIAADRMEVVETKKGNFFVQINNASKRMLATSADYKNRTSAENAAASIKRWAKSAVIVVEDDEK